jgi:hypothetical protein
LHPLTARITALITSTPALASPEQVGGIECEVWTSSRRSPEEEEEEEEEEERKWRVSFSRRDGVVRFARRDVGKFWLDGREVESYECHQVHDALR